MVPERALSVLLSVLIILLVALVQERSRHLAAIIATMPLTAPLAMWIVFSASRGDQRQTADFVGSMVIGAVASLVFVLACWFGLRHEWGFLATLAFLRHLAPDRVGSALGRTLAALSTQALPCQRGTGASAGMVALIAFAVC